MASGPAAGLAIVAALDDEPLRRDYHLLQSVRGDLLERPGRHDEARRAFERAAALTRDQRQRDLLTARAGMSAARAAESDSSSSISRR